MADLAKLKENLLSVKEKIKDAASNAGRSPDEVKLVAVTKTVPVEIISGLYDLGERTFGENRAQVGVPKIKEFIKPGINWHFIGHLQRNKVKELFPGFSFLHSLDSLRLAQEIQKHGEKLGYKLDVTIEVKTSEEDSKQGISNEDEIFTLVEQVMGLSNLSLKGLMTMAPYFKDAEKTRPYFAELRKLRDRISEKFLLDLPELSMGMSNDYVEAVGEGATLVRVGSALFDGVVL